jgi:hypothetical protein
LFVLQRLGDLFEERSARLKPASRAAVGIPQHLIELLLLVNGGLGRPPKQAVVAESD